MFGRKTACILAFSIRATGMVIYGFSHSFWEFVIAEVIAGIGLTFENGALQAWAIDRLKHSGGHDTIEAIYQRKAQLKLMGAIVGSMCGAIVGTANLAWPWFCGAGVLFLTSIATAILMREEYFEKKRYSFTQGLHAFRTAISDGLQFGLKSPAIQFLFIANAAFLFAVQAPNMFWQLYFKPYISVHAHYQYGLIHACALGGMFLGTSIAAKIVKRFGSERKAILASFGFVGIWLAVAGALPIFAICFPAFILHEIGRGLFDPIKDKYLNPRIPSESRATLDSLQSTTRHIGSVAGLFVSGIVAARFSDGASWILSGVILIIVTSVLALRMRMDTSGTS